MTTPIIDSTENARRLLAVQINSSAADRAILEARYGRVWDSHQVAADFVVVGLGAPRVVVRRKTDNQLGSLFFQHDPRYYFAFKEDQ